jgi:hypothetical protein
LLLKRKIHINPKTGITYIPKDIVSSGYKRGVDLLANAVTVTLIKPGTDLASVKQSLEITIRDIDLRIQQGEQ